jgi:hypothetical protein
MLAIYDRTLDRLCTKINFRGLIVSGLKLFLVCKLSFEQLLVV